ncbi:hypothetical protein C8A00DRAFT_46486 [Chaetomidium leptoderma]|uniref:GED domain-containing protein n=1 Tax=Chaetomidium leptoderma TaxID=669021 RepID=A0AAN6VGE4_9PEZI|nr:hypothetical protein C8A00DRAFT_46486 [Chaetomidium leptoderma]
MNPADGSANGAQLQSKEYRDLLDVVDRLRNQGLSRYVDLPQIIVCGDHQDNLCTRFATELILRRAPVAGIDISISPGSDRTEDEQATLEAFTYTGTLETLDLGLSGPSQPHLTLVDLPGLFLAGNKDQSEQDAALIEKLAKSDFALQQRTLGLITKPDTLDQGSDSEQFYIQLAQNKDVHFGLGWHVLRNRTYAERNDSAAARDAAEADFFSNGVWTSLKPSQLGLPSVLEDVTEGIDECRATLQQLGTPRVTSAEQRRHLLKVSARWSEMARAAIDGTYTDSFFHEAADRRLRAVMQKTLAAFAKEMHLKGHAKNIIHYSDEEDSDDDMPGPHVIRRSTYIDEVKMLMVDSRGRELPGTYNPLIVAELFRKQCKPWHGMVRSVLESTFHAASRTTESILQHAADEETATALLSIVVAPAMEVIRAGLWSEADKILKPHILGHPITYNHYLTDNVQKAQAQRLRLKLEEQLKSFSNTSELSSSPMNYKLDMLKLFDKLTVRMEPDMDTCSCSMAIDMMEAYYKVALETVIDSVSTLAVERCLLQKLPGILNPEVVCELPDDIVSRIAAEGPESVAKREQATEKLAVLEEAMVELRRLGTLGGQGTEGVTAV